MHKGSVALSIVLLIGSAPQCRAQVLSPAEIQDSPMRELQQKHFAELKAAAVEISSREYPYRFYLSRTLDVTAQQEQQIDQRSIRFANFQGRTVLQVTGNYFAAYSDRLMDRNERVKRTYLDVILPMLRAMAPVLVTEPQLTAFALEISHHVRKQVLGVTVEKPENLALIIPRVVAEKAAKSKDVFDQLTALRASSVYVDGSPTMLWSEQNSEASAKPEPGNPPPVAAIQQPLEPAPVLPAPASAQMQARDLSSDALRQTQSSVQQSLDSIVRELDSQAHFVGYAPPTLIAFRKSSYLQLSVTTTLTPSDAGSQYRIAALAFDRHVSHLIRPVLEYFKQDPDFDGIVFSSTVRIPGTTADSAVAQSIEFFLPMAELRRYKDYDMTGQQLINSGLVLINGERVGLDLQNAESGIK